MSGLELKGSVGNMMDNNEEDVVVIKKALHDLGFRKNPLQNGIIEQETDDAIREFQKAKGLKVDGYLIPGGETEEALNIERAVINQKEHADKIEEVWRGHIKWADRMGYNDAARYLNHYLDGSGQEISLGKKDLDTNKTFIHAVKENQKRFEESFTDPKHAFYAQMEKIRPFESKVLINEDGEDGDSWDYETSPTKLDIKRNTLVVDGIDRALSIGSNKIRSNGKFKVTRLADKVAMTGNVVHNFNDRYDFHTDASGGKTMLTLERYGKAQPFSVKGRKMQDVMAVFDYKNGKIENPKFYWYDKDER